MTAETPNSGQSGGISNTGTLIATNVAGRDQTNTTTTTYYSPTEIHNVWQPVADAIQSAPPEKQTEATTKFEELKAEAADIRHQRRRHGEWRRVDRRGSPYDHRGEESRRSGHQGPAERPVTGVDEEIAD
jgi:hypothetical protein